MSADPPAAARACLEVRDLQILYRTAHGPHAAAAGVSLEVAEGECVGIVGESGSGKSQTLLASLGLLSRAAQVSGSVRFRGEQLLGADAACLNRIRGRYIGMVFQDPMTSLSPHLRIGTQLSEVLRTHRGMASGAAREAAVRMLERVHIDAAPLRLRQFPHELSGGMRQRVMIAMACLCGPALLIADEPTTALDATVQAQVLEVLRALRAELGMALVLITHDFAVLAGMADRVLVMYAGRIVEAAATRELLVQPLHPYSAGLLDCVPRVDADPRSRLPSIEGQPPTAGPAAPGCAFAPRCRRASQQCLTSRPALRVVREGRAVACHHPHE